MTKSSEIQERNLRQYVHIHVRCMYVKEWVCRPVIRIEEVVILIKMIDVLQL